MPSPLDRNRLADEPSPYLIQHADNPVHWQPWDDTALDEAAELDRPIFCSIGYAACHWCHVMEDESFEDERVAERLNSKFVPIKVDREERPDVDRIYQTICQLVSGSGGWPLSVFLTPDGRPFYVGTYFPPEPKRGRPGFIEILDRIADSWESDREAIEDRADQWEDAIQQETAVPAPDQSSAERDTTLEAVARSALRSVDHDHGGFGEQGPKFPQPQRIELLLRADAKLDDPDYLDAATATLDVMAERGLYDHLGGGFHRYATDREWRIPHFEKMLYDNGELTRIYSHAYQITGRDRYAEIVEETLAFVERELQHQAGGFFSTLDAQSEGREGAFYVWTPDQVHEFIDDEQVAELVCEYYGITASGNFENGTTVLQRSRSVTSLADSFDLSTEAVQSALDTGREELEVARAERPRPARDEKILTAWNGLMISGFAAAGLVIDERWLSPATTAMSFLRDTLWDADAQTLHRRYKDGEIGIPGYLDDYAFLGRAAIDLYQVTGEFTWLAFAVDLGDVLVEEFWSPDDATLYFTPESGETLVSRPQDRYDQSTPSSLAVGLELLSTLDHFVPDRGFGDLVEQAMSAHRSSIAGAPLQHVGLANVADRVDSGQLEWTIVANDIPTAWRTTIADVYDPDRVITRRPPDTESLATWIEQLELSEAPPIWADRAQQQDEPTVYLCRDFTCSSPLIDPGEAATWLDRLDAPTPT